jgi:GNAT superfamily N-acetyltransferase
MTTYYLSRDETRAYLLDLLRRLERFESRPTVWCPITRSGEALLGLLVELATQEFPHLIEEVRLVPIDMVNGRTTATFPQDNAEELRGQSVLLLDGAIHSGGMMSACAAEVLKYEPSELASYTLVMKRGSSFIPTLWGLMIEETDRAFFLLDEIPNHRLDAVGHNGPTRKPQPPVHLQRLDEQMVNAPLLTSGVASMDRIRWSDRHFQMVTSGHQICTYVLRRGAAIAGFVTLHGLPCGGLMVDEVVSDPEKRGIGYGGILMRFADTLARQGKCRVVRLLAIRDKVEWYEKHEFRRVSDAEWIRLDDEEYLPMEKAVLYHQSPIR